MINESNRRQFLKTGASVGLGLALGGIRPTASASHKQSSAANEINLPPIDKVSIGIIGMGGRGNSLMGNFLQMKADVEVRAVCDIYPERAKAAQDRVVKAGFNKPEAYSGNENIWKKLVERDDLDAVIIATYWQWHTPMAVYTMKAGKYAAS